LTAGRLQLFRAESWLFGVSKTGITGKTPSAIGKEPNMLWTLFVILVILWLLGLVSGYTMGGVIHILLVIAVVVVLVRFIQGRR
jgi:hypothetical protein